MKKFTILLILLAALCGLIGLTACDDQPDNVHTPPDTVHTHDWSDWTVETPATCTKEGVEKRVCAADGESETRPIPKTSHTPAVLKAVEATCTTPGKTEGSYCSVCETVLEAQKEIPAPGHAEAIDPAVAPTCTAPGKTQGKHCLICDTVLEQQTEIPAVPHTRVKDEAVEATCTTPGKTEGEHCSVCNEVFLEQKEIPALGHTYDGTWQQLEGSDFHFRTCTKDGYVDRQPCQLGTTVHAPTCTDAGYTHYGCDLCKRGYDVEGEPATGHSYDDTFLPRTDKPGYHYKPCKNDPDNPEHYYEEPCVLTETVTEPTCESGGYTIFSCATCTYHYRGAETEKLNHHWGAWRHSDSKVAGSSTHIRYCTLDESHFEEKPCEFDGVFTEPTCVSYGYWTYTCDDCDYRYEQHTDEKGQPYAPVGHNYTGVAWTSNHNGTHQRMCKTLGCGHIDTQGCNYPATGRTVDPTCTAKGYTSFVCSDCNYEDKRNEQNMIPHRYTQWEQIEGENNHSHACEMCGTEQKEPCKFRYETVNPTCTQPGYTNRICDTCGDIDKINETQPLQHNYGDWQPNGIISGVPTHKRVCKRDDCDSFETDNCEMVEISGIPTCTNPVDVKKVCKQCHFTEDLEDIEALNHLWSAWKCDRQGHHYRVCERPGCQGGESGQPAREEGSCRYQITTRDRSCTQSGERRSECSDCHNVVVEDLGAALGHDWGAGWTSKDDKTHTRTCLRCETREEGSCQFETQIFPVTCEANGYTLNTCKSCENSYKSDEKEATGHDYSIYETNNNGTHTIRCSHDRTHFTEESCAYSAGVVTDPTCETDGYTTKTCQKCAYSETYNRVDRLEHRYGAWQKSTRQGYHYRVCERNGEHREEVTCSSFISDTVTPTCESRGYTTKTCKDCGYSYETDEKNALGHAWTVSGQSTNKKTHPVVCTRDPSHKSELLCNYNMVETPATCVDAGYHTHTCTDCGYSYRDGDSAPTGHSYGSWQFDIATHTHSRVCLNRNCSDKQTGNCQFEEGNSVLPTCTVAGYTVMTCTTCRGSYDGDPIPAKGHEYGDPVYLAILGNRHRYFCNNCAHFMTEDCVIEENVVAATCTTDGYTEKYCTKGCGRPMTKTKIVPARGHVMSTQWQYTGDQAQTHTHELRCTREDCDFKQEGTCNFVPINTAATCLAPGRDANVCEKCNFTKDIKDYEALQHQLSGWLTTNTGTHYQKCLRCSYREEGSCSDSFDIVTKPASCTEVARTIKTCTLCKYEVVESSGGEPRGHNWKVISSTKEGHEIVCQYSDCGEKMTGNHIYTESNICPCEWDGLTYTQPENAAYVIVSGDYDITGAKHIVIPAVHDGLPVEYIGKDAFTNNLSILTVELPKSLKEIGELAFYCCMNLRSVSLADSGQDSLIKIGRYAFNSCKALESITLPETLTTIGEYAFQYCSSLLSVNIPTSVTSIGKRAFNGSKFFENETMWSNDALYVGGHLLSVRKINGEGGKFTISSTTHSVAADCFENRTDLIELVIPNSVTIFDADAFEGCVNLNKVTFSGNVAEWLAIRFENDLASPMHYAVELTIQNAEPNADDQTLDLSKVTITEGTPVTVAAIPAGTFRNVKGIKHIILPESVTSIGANAFYGCSDLEDVTVKGTLTFIGENAFFGTKFYDTEENWEEDGILYLDDVKGGHYLLAGHNSKLHREITVKAGTLVIAPRAFKSCDELAAITIPDSVTYIGEEAFKGCTHLLNATFEGQVSFFATNDKGVGRIYSTFGTYAYLANPATAAYYLREYLPSAWNKV